MGWPRHSLLGLCSHVVNEFCSRIINQIFIDSNWCSHGQKCKRWNFVHSFYKYLFSPTKTQTLCSFLRVQWQKRRYPLRTAECVLICEKLTMVLRVFMMLRSQATIQEMFRNGKLIFKHLLRCQLGGCQKAETSFSLFYCLDRPVYFMGFFTRV